MAIDTDRVRVFLECPSKYSITRGGGLLKRSAASRTLHPVPWLRRRCWSGELREDGYAVRVVGDRVIADLIRRHIRRHTVEQATKQPGPF